MSVEVLITAKFRPDVYHAYTADGKTKLADLAKEEARQLFAPNLPSEIAAGDPILGELDDTGAVGLITTHFFATPTNRSGGFVAFVTIDPIPANDQNDPNDPYQAFWRATIFLNKIYDIQVEPYSRNEDAGGNATNARIDGMIRTGSWH